MLASGTNRVASGDDSKWIELARAPRLAVITDLDGTLVPFHEDPERAVPSTETIRLLRDLARLEGTVVLVASGRTRAELERHFGDALEIGLVAEHGAAVRIAGVWSDPASERGLASDPRLPKILAELADALERVTSAFPGSHVERKRRGFAVHVRGVAVRDKRALVVVVSAMVEERLSREPSLERLDGNEVIEVRIAGISKRIAVDLARRELEQGGPVLALGDDTTDEDVFDALGPNDAGVRVGPEMRPSGASTWIAGVTEAFTLLSWVRDARAAAVPPPFPATIVLPSLEAGFDLLVVSNRLPELRSSTDQRGRNVGGLVSALAPSLERMRGVWLGWSGRVSQHGEHLRRGMARHGNTALASVDLPEDWLKRYYSGYSNSTLWPLLHSFLQHVRLTPGDWDAYQMANQAFAEVAASLIAPTGTVWIHDYHLLSLGQAMRAKGHTGPIGLFLHIPFCGPDLFFTLPQAELLLKALLSFDLIGFHTAGYADNFIRCVRAVEGVNERDGTIRWQGRETVVGVHPIGIIPKTFQPSSDEESSHEVEALLRDVGDRKLVVGVDRLDYTKGIPERLEAFGRMLAAHPSWRGRVCLVQVSVPSRADVPEYAAQRAAVESIVGRVNGEYSETGWVPIRYLYRSYGIDVLAQLYRAAHVGYVTPLRDGMNLVAKEYVAAQAPEDPGVLLLSRFAGAAEELRAAVLTNPYDGSGMAEDLARALAMPLEERRARHAALLAVVSGTTAVTWAERFLEQLEAVRASALPALRR